MASAVRIANERKPSLEGLVTKTVPLSLLSGGNNQATQRTMNIIPSRADTDPPKRSTPPEKPSSLSMNDSAFNSNDRSPQEVVRLLKSVSKDLGSPTDYEQQLPPLKPREETALLAHRHSTRRPLSSESDTSGFQQAFQQLEKQEE